MVCQEFLAASGASLMLDRHLIGALRAHFDGDVLEPADAGYDEARAVWNAMIDKRPALIARCRSTADVIEAGENPTPAT
jgi:hypothetical protein